jgi:hypothetical protein
MAKKKPNFLSSAEISAEDNYNMVGDGIINNQSRPSMLVHLEALEQRKRERHSDMESERAKDARSASIADSRRERHKDDHHQSLSEH